jgi:DNA-binding response OmpR family regulator
LEYGIRLAYELEVKLKSIKYFEKLFFSPSFYHRIDQTLHPYMKILIIDDHPKIRENIAHFLTLNNIASDTAATGAIGLRKLQENSFDCVLLDMNMPLMNGREFLRSFRNTDTNTPILVLTSDNQVGDIVTVLDLGADDYLTKPFSFEELLARIHALTRRRGGIVESTIAYGPYTINLRANTLMRGDVTIPLTHKEWLLFETLYHAKWKPLSKWELCSTIWGNDELLWESMSLEAHIYSLRKKIGSRTILTQRNIGYSLVIPYPMDHV